MSKTIRISRLVIRGDRGIEPPSEREGDWSAAPLSTFQRFPRALGREPKNTPYEMAYDTATGLITIKHPRSGLAVTVPREHCYWYPFSVADEKREAEELEKATAPETRATA